VYDLREGSNFIIFHMEIQYHFFEETILSPLCPYALLKLVFYICLGLFLISIFFSTSYPFLCQYYTVLMSIDL
jgi:hypothetical protein